MRRTLAVMSAVVTLFTGTANATNIWLSEAGIPPGSAVGKVPDILALSDSSNQINIYARPDPGATLVNWQLNLASSTPGIIAFTNIEVVNPYLANSGFPFNLPIHRYEFKNDSSTGFTISDPNRLDGITAFGVSNEEVIGAGIGPQTEELDPAYDPRNDTWLLVTVDYDVIAIGHTDLFLEIGESGINNVGEDAGDIDVIFGDSVDEPRNGKTGRVQPTTNPQASIWSIPGPSTIVLAVLGLLGLPAMHRRAY